MTHRRLSLRAALAALSAFVAAVPVAVRAQPAGIVQVGRLDTRAGDLTSANAGYLSADTGARRLYEVRPEGTRVVVDLYDLDSLRYLASAAVDDGNRSGTLPVLVDEVRHRVFVTYFKGAQAGRQSWVAVVDGRTLQVLSHFQLNAGALNPGRIYAMDYFPPEDKLYTLAEVVTSPVSVGDSGTSTTVLNQIDATRGTVDWSFPVPACQRPLGTDAPGFAPGPLARSRLRAVVYFGCTVNQPVANYRFPGTPAVVRVRIDPSATQLDALRGFVTETFPIGGEFSSGLVDPLTERVFMVNRAGGAEGATVFDGRRNVFLGTIALNRPASQLGINLQTGRVIFADAQSGLMVADGRTTPLSQGLLFPQFRTGRGGLVVVDPLTNRYFVKFKIGDLEPAKDAVFPYYMVLQDRVPTLPQPPPPDPDRNTADVDERPGVTGVNFAAGASAFGARSLTVGGLGALQDNLIGVEAGFTIRQRLTGLDRLLPIHPRLGDPFFPSPGDRDVYLARVQKAFLSTGEASARAIAADRDANTEGDLFNASHPSGPNPDPRDPSLTGQPQDLNKTGAELAWPWGGVECADFGSRPPPPAGEERPGSRSAVTCDASGEAKAEALLEGLAGEVSVGRVWASGRVFRDPVRGVVAQAVAEARGIQVGSLLTVQRVATAAETAARGRPGAARGAFARAVEGLTVYNPFDGSVLFSCGDAFTCRDELASAQQAVRSATDGHVQLLFPSPDPSMMAGTPGGYEALVRKAEEEALSDKATNNDDRLEVPGMVLVLQYDNHSRWRQILQFAGVETESHYGIFLLPTLEPGPAAGLGPPQPGGSFVETAVASAVTPAPPPAPAPPAPPQGPVSFRTVVRHFVEGFRLAFSSPRQFALGVTVWGFFAAPIYLLLRRRQALADLEGSR